MGGGCHKASTQGLRSPERSMQLRESESTGDTSINGHPQDTPNFQADTSQFARNFLVSAMWSSVSEEKEAQIGTPK